MDLLSPATGRPVAHPFPPSDEQLAFWRWVLHGRGSALLNAVAGAGKSTSVVEALPYWPERWCVQLLAFNADAARDLREKVAALAAREGLDPSRWRADTFHAKGFGAVCKKLDRSPREVETDGRKLSKICDEWLGDETNERYGAFVSKLVSFAKGEGIGCLVPDVEDRWHALIAHHDMYLDDADATEAEAVSLARQLLLRSNEKAKDGHIDFDDQIYLPILWRLRLWQNDVVVVDEAQDTNPCRRALAKLMLRPGGRLVAVGDPDQAINGFTGASADAMELIRREFDCQELGLSVSYRCSKAAIRRAQTLVPRIRAHAGAAEGTDETILKDEMFRRVTPADAVLCRNTASLISTAYEMIARGIGCRVIGREIGQNLVALVKKMRARTLDGLLERLDAYEAREVAKHTAKGEEMKAEAVHDRVDCLRVVAETLREGERTVPALVRKLDGLFSDGSAGLVPLLTVHKSKGREYSNVFVIRPDLMPSRWARQDHQRAQEDHLMYVAWTRTKGTIADVVEPRRARAGAAELLAGIGLTVADAPDGEEP